MDEPSRGYSFILFVRLFAETWHNNIYTILVNIIVFESLSAIHRSPTIINNNDNNNNIGAFVHACIYARVDDSFPTKRSKINQNPIRIYTDFLTGTLC